jgi:ActR/RegA family two-component response regulator
MVTATAIATGVDISEASDMAPNARPSILIIEDDETNCEGLVRLLKRRGFASTCCETLAEGLACFRSQEFACVVLDLGLADSPHRDTAHAIPEFHPVPVVAITGNDDRELIRICRQHGAGYALKGGSALDIMQKVLLATERANPSRHIEEEIISVSRELNADRGGEAKPWWLQWVPLVAVAISLFGASGTAGMFLYRAIAGEAAQSVRNAHRFELLEKSMNEFKLTMESHSRTQNEIVMKTQSSLEDRQGMHREMANLRVQNDTVRAEVLRRLERIEDNVQLMMKELVGQKRQ